ncbi:hypothetical protein FISHEDRAFT_74945 [Fistulina hepatica ATCC 64428]|uniref:Uncharacterized protein n=1 Tax=Fistulina hepatica ATCC 64428 TaxID=1128425 RepID=A0A0D7AB29_9AGAR|nr:hypothetical protein FISHEDRAFT_74945 [Fistulina hepatica ATCC 64428]
MEEDRLIDDDDVVPSAQCPTLKFLVTPLSMRPRGELARPITTLLNTRDGRTFERLPRQVQIRILFATSGLSAQPLEIQVLLTVPELGDNQALVYHPEVVSGPQPPQTRVYTAPKRAARILDAFLHLPRWRSRHNRAIDDIQAQHLVLQRLQSSASLASLHKRRAYKKTLATNKPTNTSDSRARERAQDCAHAIASIRLGACYIKQHRSEPMCNLAAETAAYLTMKHPDHSTRALLSLIFTRRLPRVPLLLSSSSMIKPRPVAISPMISDGTYNVVMDNAAVLDSAVIYNRDFSYNYFGFKML